MKKFTKWMWAASLVIGFVALAHAATTFQRFVVNGLQIWLLQNDGTVTQPGALKFGNDSVTPTLPTAANGGALGVKIPTTVVTTAATTGTLLCATNLGVAYTTPCTTSGATTIVGVADSAIAVNAVGYMTVAGYAVALTTGTVVPGDVIVSTSASTGYGATNNSPSASTQIGVAMSTGTSAGGLTLIRVK